MPEVGQRSHNPVVSPVGVLARQAHHQILKLRMDAWSSHGPALFRTVEFVSDESAVPGEKGIGFSDMGHFLERFAPQAFANLGQRDPLAIGQPKSRPEVRLQNVVLPHEIFVLQKEFLIHQAGHIRQKAHPLVVHLAQRPS